MKRATILGGRTGAFGQTTPFAPVFGFVKAVGTHFAALGADGDPRWGNLDVTARGSIFMGAWIEINDGVDVEMMKQAINGFSIMSRIEKDPTYRAQGEPLLEFNHA